MTMNSMDEMIVDFRDVRFPAAESVFAAALLRVIDAVVEH
jgi:hypothetical protein